jgi:hypothetical protein
MISLFEYVSLLISLMRSRASTVSAHRKALYSCERNRQTAADIRVEKRAPGKYCGFTTPKEGALLELRTRAVIESKFPLYYMERHEFNCPRRSRIISGEKLFTNLMRFTTSLGRRGSSWPVQKQILESHEKWIPRLWQPFNFFYLHTRLNFSCFAIT